MHTFAHRLCKFFAIGIVNIHIFGVDIFSRALTPAGALSRGGAGPVGGQIKAVEALAAASDFIHGIEQALHFPGGVIGEQADAQESSAGFDAQPFR
jgi:hypothetical protein